MKNKLITTITTISILCTCANHQAAISSSNHCDTEKEYVSQWCTERGGVQEYYIDADNGGRGTFVDCLLPDYAVEADRAPKFYEAIGQALYYSIKTDREPMILLIIETESDYRHYNRLMEVASEYDIAVEALVVE
jgi:hypothetical protein